MKYSIPLKKLLPLVQDELTKDSLHQISKIPIDLKVFSFFIANLKLDACIIKEKCFT